MKDEGRDRKEEKLIEIEASDNRRRTGAKEKYCNASKKL